MAYSGTPSFKVLLTGFQGWGTITTNPSELIGKQLDGAVLQLPDHSKFRTGSEFNPGVSSVTSSDPELSTGSAIVTFQPLRVSYREVEKLIPAAHESGEWDYIVHLGVAAGKKTCAIETGSNTTGYTLRDVDGAMAPELEDGRGISCDEARWECTLDYQECCEELNDMGFEHVKLSADPGNFLCGYTTACSLKSAYGRVAKDEGRKPIPVVFFHVPLLKETDPTAPYTLSELTEIVRALCGFAARQASTNVRRHLD
ncbi:hypothetical protein QFC20_001754 [Naganishia adeliensis]|uniref:Uncharacterized protein n=1 Tax=Naganishia adeliensis TaxID=92952 RepID=A0ACC2WRD4_9TREE|nr:hypothetical protein QFC20_001754 [Naganishia adeliensis]